MAQLEPTEISTEDEAATLDKFIGEKLKLLDSSALAAKKQVIAACTRLYPHVLAWANQRKHDKDAEKCWKKFAVLKTRILSMIDSSNEGLRLMCIKFMETMIICQSNKSEFSAPSADGFELINLADIHRDHRVLSVRQLEAETQHGILALLDRLSSPEVASQTLLTIAQAICNIARQRPGFMLQILSALESLHVNLPPTLATCHVKSLRKEQRYELLSFLKLPVNISYHRRLTQLLSDLGCSQSEIQRYMPTPSEVSAALKKRADLASAAAMAAAPADRERSALIAGVGRTIVSIDEELDPKRVRLDGDENARLDDSLGDANSTEEMASTSQRALDITTDFVYERLSVNVVIKLVTISLFTLPDTMPAAFQSSYTSISDAGTEVQKKKLSRMIAAQLMSEGEGPGMKYFREERQKQFFARQHARADGAIIMPTPTHEPRALAADEHEKRAEKRKAADENFAAPTAPAKRGRIVKWDLLKMTAELGVPEAEKLALMAFKRVLESEKSALQGGAIHAQQLLIVRLATRYHYYAHTTECVEESLIAYIVNDPKNRADLALMWLRELYAQVEGTLDFITAEGAVEEKKRRARYDKILCSMLAYLVERNGIKDILFHRLLLEAPLVTSSALNWLRKACLDPTFGSYSHSTLRELIIKKKDQRRELLDVFLLFSYQEPPVGPNNERLAALYDVRESCVNTAKELFEVEAVRDELRDRIVEMSEQLTLPSAPLRLVAACRRLSDEEARELGEQVESIPWDEPLIRSALYLFMAMLPIDHTLLAQLARVTANAKTNEVKRVIFRSVERAVKAIGMESPALLDMIENCPIGAEPLVARVVHLLTERSAPTSELVDKVRTLHKERNTDVRSLLPILTGIPKEDLRALIPKFVMNATNSKSVPLFFRKLLFGRQVATHQPLMSPGELLCELHHCATCNAREQSHLVQHIDQLIVDTDGTYQLSKELIARAIEDLLQEDPLPKLLYHTIERVYSNVPALKGFLINVLKKTAQTHEDPKLEDLIQTLPTGA